MFAEKRVLPLLDEPTEVTGAACTAAAVVLDATIVDVSTAATVLNAYTAAAVPDASPTVLVPAAILNATPATSTHRSGTDGKTW